MHLACAQIHMIVTIYTKFAAKSDVICAALTHILIHVRVHKFTLFAHLFPSPFRHLTYSARIFAGYFSFLFGVVFFDLLTCSGAKHTVESDIASLPFITSDFEVALCTPQRSLAGSLFDTNSIFFFSLPLSVCVSTYQRRVWECITTFQLLYNLAF